MNTAFIGKNNFENRSTNIEVMTTFGCLNSFPYMKLQEKELALLGG